VAAQLFSGTGDPNGVVHGSPGDVYQDKAGVLWINVTAPTTWSQITSGTDTSQRFDWVANGSEGQTIVVPLPVPIPSGQYVVEVTMQTVNNASLIPDVPESMKTPTGFTIVTSSFVSGGDTFGIYVNTKTAPDNVPAPVVEVYNPSTGLAGDTIQVLGLFFTGVTAVDVNGVPAASFTFVSDGEIDIVLPVSTTGPISVTTPAGVGVGPPFTYSHWRQRAFAPQQSVLGNTFLLGTGQILAFGGTDGLSGQPPQPGSENCFLYDPVANTWGSTGALNFARKFYATSFLADGRVLIIGGIGSDGLGRTDAEIYDPGTGLWTLTTGSLGPTMNNVEITGTLLNDGTVLVAGGIRGGTPNLTAYLFNPGTGLFTLTTGALPAARVGPQQIKIPGGDVMVISGDAALGRGTMIRYHAGTQTFTAAAAMITPRAGSQFGLALLPSGKVITIAGETTNVVEIYDPVGDTWASANPISDLVSLPQVSVLPSGDIFRSAGFVTGGGTSFATEIYNEGTGLWTPSDDRALDNTPITTLLNNPVVGTGVFVMLSVEFAIGSQPGSTLVEQWRP
jgi:hypothetical protein